MATLEDNQMDDLKMAEAISDFDKLSEEDELKFVEAAKRAGVEAAEQEIAADKSKLEEELVSATKALDEAKQLASDAQDRFLRLQADWDNYRRRTAAERLVEKALAAEKLVVNLLPVIDDLERGFEHAKQTAEGNDALLQFLEGMQAAHTKLLSVLEKEDVMPINPVGEPFDPLAHQAVGCVDDPQVFDETVAEVYQKGYRMGEKIIRSAMVTVTHGGPQRPKEEPAQESTPSEEDKQ